MKLLPRSSRKDHLGAEAPVPLKRAGVKLKVIDRNGVPVRNAPFRMEVFPLASCDTNCAAHYHKMNRDTDEKGVVLFEIYPATFKGGMFYEENRVVTLRALFDYPGKDKLNDPPILERKELFFAWEPQETVIKLEPGGGLDKKEEVLPPVQDQAPSEPSPSPKKEGGFSYAPLLVGGAFLVAGIIFIPMIIRSFSGRDR